MKPLVRFHTVILSLTTTIIFIGWIKLSTIIIQHPFISVISAGLFSISIYRILLSILANLIKRIWWVKKLFYGRFYMEGVWVGFFIGNEDKIRYFIEVFEQDFEDLRIKGESFKEEGGYHGMWESEATNINIKKAKLTYTYQTDSIDNTFINPGIAVFNLKRKTTFKPPYELIGFSSDLYSGNKIKSLEIKISDKTFYNTIKALERAKTLYESKGDTFK